MELKKNCVKLSYCGQMRYIICEAGCRYEDILKMAIERFNIPTEYQSALTVTNEHGYTFDKLLFEYFVLLFPNPEIIFYVRVDYVKVERLAKLSAKRRDGPDDAVKPFGYSKLNNKRTLKTIQDEEELEEILCGAVPVRRQNCFLGSFPMQSAAGQPAEFTRQVSKRMRLLQQQKPKSKKPKTTAKRLLRV